MKAQFEKELSLLRQSQFDEHAKIALAREDAIQAQASVIAKQLIAKEYKCFCL